MSDDKKPREWRLDASNIYESQILDAYPVSKYDEHSVNDILVIEKSAYDELKAKAEKHRAALELIAKNKTEDREIYTMGCDCDDVAREALKE